MIERIIDAEYTAVKQEGTVPPCENSVVEVSATYKKEFTLEDGDSFSDIDTTDLMVGSVAHDGGTTYTWDGSQWVASGGGVTPTGTIEITENGTVDVTQYASANVNVSGGTETLQFREITLTNGRNGADTTYSSLVVYPFFVKNGIVFSRSQAVSKNATKTYNVPIALTEANPTSIDSATKRDQYTLFRTAANKPGITFSGTDASYFSVVGTFNDANFLFSVVKIDHTAPQNLTITIGLAS